MLDNRSKLDRELSSEERIIVESLRYFDETGFEDQFQELAEKVRKKNMELWNIYNKLS